MMDRIISGSLAAIYVLVAYLDDGGEAAFKIGLFLLLPLACIWYSDAMGSYTGWMGRGHITRTTPGCMVAFMGWCFLLMPIIVGIGYLIFG